jgi:hypothetical protein
MMRFERNFSFIIMGMLVMSVFMVGGVLGQEIESFPLENSPIYSLEIGGREYYLTPSNDIYVDTTDGNYDLVTPSKHAFDFLESAKDQSIDTFNYNDAVDKIISSTSNPTKQKIQERAEVLQNINDVFETPLTEAEKEASSSAASDGSSEYDENPSTNTEESSGTIGDDSFNLNPDGNPEDNPRQTPPEGFGDDRVGESSFFPPIECAENTEDAGAFDADVFFKNLGARPDEAYSDVPLDDPSLVPVTLEKDGDGYALVEEFTPAEAAKNEEYIAQMNAFNALDGEEKQTTWDEISKTPELKKRFLNTLQERYSSEEKPFKLFDGMKSEDLPDIDWTEGGQIRVGAKDGNGGVVVDLCAIEKYNSEDNLGKDFKYNLEGGEYSAKPSRLLGIDSVTNPETDKKELRYTFANGAFMDIAGSEADGGRMYDLENRKLMIKDKDEESGVSASWMNNRGRVRVDESGALKVGMTNGADGKFNTEGLDFAIMEVGEGDNKRIISPYQRRIDAFPGGEEITKPTGSGSNVFRRVGDEVFSINKDGQAFQVGEGSYQLVGDEEHFEYSYAEISGEGGQEKGQFFFGAERRDKDGKRLGLNNFALRTSEDGKVSDVNLFGNVLYEQTGDMGNIIMGEGDQRMVNGDFVISRNEKGELETRSLTGKKGGKLSHKGDVFTEYGDENSPEVDRLKLEDAAVGERLVKEVVTEEVKEEIPGRKDTTKGDVGTLSGGGGISDPDLKKAYDTSIAAYGGFSKLSNNENENGIYALAFTATWCGPCNSMKTNIGNGNSISGSIVNVDTDIHGGLTQRYAITELPTVVYINSLTGMEVGRRINPSQNTVTILNNEFKKTS